MWRQNDKLGSRPGVRHGTFFPRELVIDTKGKTNPLSYRPTSLPHGLSQGTEIPPVLDKRTGQPIPRTY